MTRTYLGEFEEVVLLTIAVLPEPAYGVVITQQIEMQTGRSADFSTVHTTLKRLEEKRLPLFLDGGCHRPKGWQEKTLLCHHAGRLQSP